MTGIAKAYPTFQGICPAWSWVFAETIPAGGEIESPAIQHQPPGGGGGGGAMAPLAPFVDPPPQNAVFEPGRYCATALVRTTLGSTYIYFAFQMTGKPRRLYLVSSNSLTKITWAGLTPIHCMPQPDYWFVVVLNRSAVNPAFVEGAVSVWARGFL